MYLGFCMLTVGEADANIIPAGHINHDFIERLLVKIEEALHPLCHIIGVYLLNLRQFSLIPGRSLTRLQQLTLALAAQFDAAFHQGNQWGLGAIIPDVEFGAQHPYLLVADTYHKRLRFVAGHLEVGLALEVDTAHVIAHE